MQYNTLLTFTALAIGLAQAAPLNTRDASAIMGSATGALSGSSAATASGSGSKGTTRQALYQLTKTFAAGASLSGAGSISHDEERRAIYTFLHALYAEKEEYGPFSEEDDESLVDLSNAFSNKSSKRDIATPVDFSGVLSNTASKREDHKSLFDLSNLGANSASKREFTRRALLDLAGALSNEQSEDRTHDAKDLTRRALVDLTGALSNETPAGDAFKRGLAGDSSLLSLDNLAAPGSGKNVASRGASASGSSGLLSLDNLLAAGSGKNLARDVASEGLLDGVVTSSDFLTADNLVAQGSKKNVARDVASEGIAGIITSNDLLSADNLVAQGSKKNVARDVASKGALTGIATSDDLLTADNLIAQGSKKNVAARRNFVPSFDSAFDNTLVSADNVAAAGSNKNTARDVDDDSDLLGLDNLLGDNDSTLSSKRAVAGMRRMRIGEVSGEMQTPRTRR